MVDFKHAQIRQQRAEIVSIDLICLIAHCRVKSCADLKIEFLRLSSIKKMFSHAQIGPQGAGKQLSKVIVVVGGIR